MKLYGGGLVITSYEALCLLYSFILINSIGAKKGRT